MKWRGVLIHCNAVEISIYKHICKIMSRILEVSIHELSTELFLLTHEHKSRALIL